MGRWGERMTRVSQNVFDSFLLRGNIEFGSLLGFWFRGRGLSFGNLLFLSASGD